MPETAVVFRPPDDGFLVERHLGVRWDPRLQIDLASEDFLYEVIAEIKLAVFRINEITHGIGEAPSLLMESQLETRSMFLLCGCSIDGSVDVVRLVFLLLAKSVATLQEVSSGIHPSTSISNPS